MTPITIEECLDRLSELMDRAEKAEQERDKLKAAIDPGCPNAPGIDGYLRQVKMWHDINQKRLQLSRLEYLDIERRITNQRKELARLNKQVSEQQARIMGLYKEIEGLKKQS